MKPGATITNLFLAALLAGPAWAGTVKTDVYGTTKDGATVHVFTMTNNHGMRAQVLDLGGVVCDVEAPGRDGKLANVILCQKNLAGIEATGIAGAFCRRSAPSSTPMMPASLCGWYRPTATRAFPAP